MKKKLIILSGFVFSLAPVVALAQTGTVTNCSSTTLSTINGLLCKVSQILGAVVPVLIALGVVYFIWGVITYVVAGDEEKKSKGRNNMIYGIIGLAVIIGLWGLVKILTNTFGLENNQQITLPTVPY